MLHRNDVGDYSSGEKVLPKLNYFLLCRKVTKIKGDCGLESVLCLHFFHTPYLREQVLGQEVMGGVP